MPKLNGRLPAYRCHKPTNQGVVTLDGQDLYCGPHDDETSRQRYDGLIAKWLAAGRRLPEAASDHAHQVTVDELVLAYWDFAKVYYGEADGNKTVTSKPSALLCGHWLSYSVTPLS